MALAAQAASDVRYGRVYRLAFDTYCMQHPEIYCRSAKSYAAHLTALACGVEHAGDPALYAAIQQWLNGRVELTRPETLAARGTHTIADLQGAPDADEHVRRVRAWAREVWEAYATQHTLARRWIETARSAGARGKPKHGKAR
jgi:hypothetical protein